MERNPHEFAEFCRAEQPRLVATLGLYCGDFDVAEEIAQETFARMWRDWEKVRTKDSPSAWAQRVGFNLANSFYRRKMAERRMRSRLGTPREAAHTPDVPDQLAIQAALSQLPSNQRAVLILRFYLDYSVAETAAALRLPQGTVTTHTRRGLQRLRRSIDEPLLLPEAVHA